MGTVKNVEMNYFNGIDYDIIRPNIGLSNVSDWESNLYSKNEIDNKISESISNPIGWEEIGHFQGYLGKGQFNSNNDCEIAQAISTGLYLNDKNYEYYIDFNIGYNFVSYDSRGANASVTIQFAQEEIQTFSYTVRSNTSDSYHYFVKLMVSGNLSLLYSLIYPMYGSQIYRTYSTNQEFTINYRFWIDSALDNYVETTANDYTIYRTKVNSLPQ